MEDNHESLVTIQFSDCSVLKGLLANLAGISSIGTFVFKERHIEITVVQITENHENTLMVHCCIYGNKLDHYEFCADNEIRFPVDLKKFHSDTKNMLGRKNAVYLYITEVDDIMRLNIRKIDSQNSTNLVFIQALSSDVDDQKVIEDFGYGPANYYISTKNLKGKLDPTIPSSTKNNGRYITFSDNGTHIKIESQDNIGTIGSQSIIETHHSFTPIKENFKQTYIARVSSCKSIIQACGLSKEGICSIYSQETKPLKMEIPIGNVGDMMVYIKLIDEEKMEQLSSEIIDDEPKKKSNRGRKPKNIEPHDTKIIIDTDAATIVNRRRLSRESISPTNTEDIDDEVPTKSYRRAKNDDIERKGSSRRRCIRTK